MRVAFISVSGQMGGSEVMLLEVLRALRAADGTWVLSLIVPSDGPLAVAARALAVRVTVIPLPASLLRLGEWGTRRRVSLAARLVRAACALPAYQRAVNRALISMRPDVVHSNGFKAHIVAARCRAAGAALVWHMHEYVSVRPVSRMLLRRYARRCSQVVAVSESVAEDVRRATANRVPVQVVHNAVDLLRFAPSGPAADLDGLAGLPPAPADVIRVGLVATFSRWKGHATFLAALAALPVSARIRGYIVGGAMYDTAGSQCSREELDALASSLGLAGRVGFTGFVHRTDEAIRALDIVVHASTEREAFGLVIAEAMACGRPVITSGTGGAAELIHAGIDALVHRPGDAPDLSSRIDALARDGSLRRRIGLAARDAAVQRFDARRLAAAFTSIYHSACAAGGSRRWP